MGDYFNKQRHLPFLSNSKKIVILSVTCCLILGGTSPVINSFFIKNNNGSIDEEGSKVNSEYKTTNYDDYVIAYASFRWNPRYPDPGESVTFYSTSHASNGFISSERWEFYNGYKDYGHRTSHTFEKKGKYRVTLQVRAYGFQSGFDWDSRTIYVKVGADPFPKFRCTPENPSLGEKVIMDASKSNDPDGEIISYKWSYYNSEDPENIVDLGSDEIVYHKWDKQGIYIVSLIIQDDKGNINTIEKEIHVSILKLGSFPSSSRGLSFEISNYGDINANNLEWSVEVNKYSLLGIKSKQLYQKSGTITTLNSDKSKRIEINDIRGRFCKVKIKVTAKAENAVEVCKSFYSLIFGKRIFLREGNFINPYSFLIFSGLVLTIILFVMSLFSS